MMGVRKLLDLIFDKNELKILDDILPEFKRHEKLNIEEENLQVVQTMCLIRLCFKSPDPSQEEHEAEQQSSFDPDLAKRRASLRYTESSIEVPMANGNVMKIPIADSDINISEEMNKSGVWKSLEGSSTNIEQQAKSSNNE